MSDVSLSSTLFKYGLKIWPQIFEGIVQPLEKVVHKQRMKDVTRAYQGKHSYHQLQLLHSYEQSNFSKLEKFCKYEYNHNKTKRKLANLHICKGAYL